MAEHESSLAVLIDYENLARGGGRGRQFDVRLVLNRLSDKGRVIVKRAYADWSRYRNARHDLQNLGLGLIEMPSAQEGAKNRADIQMAVDAMEIAYSRQHVDYFAIVSGDSDFTPLVGKLRELNKRVLGVGLKNATSELLVANCDEFIYYESLASAPRRGTPESHDPVELLRETLSALAREGSETPLASHVNDTMRRKDPAFDYEELGFGTLTKFLDKMADDGVVKLEKDPRSGTYRVSLADGSAVVAAREGSESDDGAPPSGRRRRRRRRGGRGSDNDRGTTDTDVSDDQREDDAAEIFEHVVTDEQPPDESELPPVDEPISYEDMIMLTPDLNGETELIEATDSGDDSPPSRSSRRRRRRGATADPEPTAADLTELSEEPAEAPAADAQDAPPEEPAAASETADAASETADAASEAGSEPEAEAESTSRRRRRRTSTAPAPPPEPEPSASDAADDPQAESEDAPKADEPSTEAEPSVDPVAAAAEATSKSRRVRRRSTTQADDAPAEEKPKRRRTTRAKKAETEEAPAAEAEATEEAPAEEKPKRRRTTRAKKADTESADSE